MLALMAVSISLRPENIPVSSPAFPGLCMAQCGSWLQTVYLLHHLIHALSVYGDIDQVMEAAPPQSPCHARTHRSRLHGFTAPWLHGFTDPLL